MRKNTDDKTIERNLIQKWRHLIKEYEITKANNHSKFKFVSDFYNAHGTTRQTFLKYYHRYKQMGDASAFLPRKRGPRWKTRRPLPYIENKVIQLRKQGSNKFEIHAILKEKFSGRAPSPSGVYNIIKRHGLNVLKKPMKENRRKIIKKHAGELGHVDCHHLSKDLLLSDNKRYYLVAVVDSCTRVAWAEITDSIKSLDVMFATMKCFHMIQKTYDIQFKELLSDNGSEFVSKNNESHHPFERLLVEMGVKHRYTRPYRPQTNGKVERFWKTLNEDLIEDTTFENLEEFQDELLQYLYYYNEHRPHQSLGGEVPKLFNQNLSTKC